MVPPRTTMAYGEAGPMHDTHEPSRKKLRADPLKFLTPSVAAATE